jgi:anti-sigma factor RsiW
MEPQISELDMMAYVDGQLDPNRIIEVEGWLADHPADAALVMQDLRLRHEIRAAVQDSVGAMPSETERLAEQLLGKLQWRRRFLRLRRAALVAALLIMGWLGHDFYAEIRPVRQAVADSILADEAAEAHRTMLLAAAMAEKSGNDKSGPDSAHLSLLLTGTMDSPIRLPEPKRGSGLRQVSAALVPWDEGSALQVLFRTADRKAVTLFASAVQDDRDVPFEVSETDNLAIVHWQRGNIVYAMIGDLPPGALLNLVRGLHHP